MISLRRFLTLSVCVLPAPTMPGDVAKTIPVMANFIALLNCINAGGGGGTLTVQDEGVTVGTPAGITLLNFVGAGVTASAVGANATITIPGGTVSPLTTKGDVWGFSSVDARIPVGTNGQVLTADSAQTLGTKWAAVPSPTTQSQEFTSSGTFTVPTNVTMVRVTMIASGGGGSSTVNAATGGGGGGAGEHVVSFPVLVSSAEVTTITIGALGTGAASGQGSAQPGVAGGDCSFAAVSLTVVCKGGLGGNTVGTSGAGGGANGSVSKAVGSPGSAGTTGTANSVQGFGGSSGGAGGNAIAAAGGIGGGSGGHPGGAAGIAAASQAGGGGGASSPWGIGGAGGNGGADGVSSAASAYGCGGGGGGGQVTTTRAGGNGTKGYCLVEWVG